jgi:hypothetical protein
MQIREVRPLLMIFYFRPDNGGSEILWNISTPKILHGATTQKIIDIYISMKTKIRPHAEFHKLTFNLLQKSYK